MARTEGIDMSGGRTTALPVLDEPVSSSPLPPLYARWIAEVLDGPLPEERHATCMDCAMCKPPEEAATGHLVRFDPRTKCCTYVPMLPNFLVGQILLDESPENAEGRESVEQRIADGVGVTPLGLMPSPEYQLIYKYAGSDGFGRNAGLRCPHYVDREGGLCGIWRHRNGVCATWYCKHERGAVGKRFWQSVEQLLTTSERHLALWCAIELGESLNALGAALGPYYVCMPGQPPSPPRHVPPQDSQLPQFFGRSAQMVGALTWNQVEEIGGPEGILLAQRLRLAYETLKTVDIPNHLRLSAVAVGDPGHRQRLLQGYSKLDLPIVSRSDLEQLYRFDGRSTTCQLRTATPAEALFEPRTLARLVDFAILSPSSPQGESAP